MRCTMSRTLWIGVAAALLLAGISCGEGEFQGFLAPWGSTVTLPDNADVKTNGVVDVYVGFSILGPDGKTPLNGVQVGLTCTNCELLHRTDGVCGEMAADTPIEIKTTPYYIKTNGQGGCVVAARVQAPALLGMTDDSYTAQLSVGLGNGQGKQYEITVSNLE
jgi:hypothetical protein